jgi:DNA helicase-2/ATP-dependent DNA helicase PcrA
MQWDDGLLDDQRVAASHVGSHVRLLAGPGTGKTLTLARRVVYLMNEEGVLPQRILALTFTRAAAFELRKRIASMLGDLNSELPRIATLHSFSLRQLLLNASKIESIPQPLRIADDWEERHVILEDLKRILNYKVKTVRERFHSLSADWQTLIADGEDWEDRFIDPRFLGAWRKHREVFGYTLRSELVYQLKKSLEQTEDFLFESEYTYLLVDEYQDLNRCDLAIISHIRDRGVEIFGAGDDDQSIYGFRYAHPEGIRRFNEDHIPSESLTLGTCVRCDRKIIKFSLFVANLDPRRLEKPLRHRSDADEGEVHILRFKNQMFEAEGIVVICKYLIEKKDYTPNDILILMRTDRNKVFSKVVYDALEAKNIPVAVQVEGTPLDTNEGRIFLAFLRLIADNKDSLALRALLMQKRNGIGDEAFTALYDIAVNHNKTFSEAVHKVIEEPELIPRFGNRIKKGMDEIQQILDTHQNKFEIPDDCSESEDLLGALRNLAQKIIPENDIRDEVLRFLELITVETNSTNLKELIRALSSSLGDEEQELDTERVNIMTMHKAKGLTSKAVIIIAAEDEYIPGRQNGEKEDDERRLLYVSLSRARHFLVVTYCDRRINKQRHTGRTSGKEHRSLTRFLKDAPITPINGDHFIEKLKYKA